MYNIKAAAKILDMPKVTIRSWETRYEAITPARTESGHRLYSDQNLEDLKWLKIQVQENGMKISEAVKQLHASRKKFIVPNKELPKREALEYDEQIEQLFQAAAEMDTERFNYLLDLHFSLFHHQTVFFYYCTVDGAHRRGLGRRCHQRRPRAHDHPYCPTAF
jgi:DNA-binding transcriptional MerR regulator